MSENRKRQLIEANAEEDKNIKRLEKQLKLNKRKSKAIPRSFVDDGLDCTYFNVILNYHYFKFIDIL